MKLYAMLIIKHRDECHPIVTSFRQCKDLLLNAFILLFFSKMESSEGEKRDVRRPMNAFLIFCKRHRSIVREKNPDLDNRSVTRILGDLWANLKDGEKTVYTDLAKQVHDIVNQDKIEVLCD